MRYLTLRSAFQDCSRNFPFNEKSLSILTYRLSLTFGKARWKAESVSA